MANYIDKNELLHAIDKRNGRLPLWLDEILMQDCKVADVAPIVHGHWICDDNGCHCIPTCSWCGTYVSKCVYNSEDATPNYCPNCGAKMDEVTK